jgi:hypothetical protein
MIKNAVDLIEAKRIALSDPELRKSLREWFNKKGRSPLCTMEYGFGDWVVWLLCTMSDRLGIDYPEFPTSDQMVDAVRVNAIGDFVAVKAGWLAKRAGFESDIDCYVEDGIVYSCIWLKGSNAKKTEKYADGLAERLNRIGYSAETSIDEEDDREVYVNAQIDFGLYVNLTKRGINPECLLCGHHLNGLPVLPAK